MAAANQDMHPRDEKSAKSGHAADARDDLTDSTGVDESALLRDEGEERLAEARLEAQSIIDEAHREADERRARVVSFARMEIDMLTERAELMLEEANTLTSQLGEVVSTLRLSSTRLRAQVEQLAKRGDPDRARAVLPAGAEPPEGCSYGSLSDERSRDSKKRTATITTTSDTASTASQ